MPNEKYSYTASRYAKIIQIKLANKFIHVIEKERERERTEIN